MLGIDLPGVLAQNAEGRADLFGQLQGAENHSPQQASRPAPPNQPFYSDSSLAVPKSTLNALHQMITLLY